MALRVSIITVNYNCSSSIKETIESILNQDFSDFEYIIIDGGSDDGSIKLIEEYIPLFKEKGISFSLISEKDEGIYDAMNKGILKSSGDWLNFMNAGDKFFSSSILSEIFGNDLSLDENVLIYGFKYQNSIPIYPKTLKNLEYGIIMANHQSMFFNKRKLNEKLIYDLRFPIYGDYELVNKLYLKYGKECFKFFNMPISIYEGGGVSEDSSFQKRKDKYIILLRNYGIMGVVKGLLYKLIKIKV